MYDDDDDHDLGLATAGAGVGGGWLILLLVFLPFGLILFTPSLLYFWWMWRKVKGRENSGLAWLFGLLGVFVGFVNFVALLGAGVAVLIVLD